jgi:hypothetical protein
VYEYETLKFVEVILRRVRENNRGGYEPNWGTLYA